jgi:hypothetical protein
MAQLALIGVDFAQGFHLHRPVPLGEIGFGVAAGQPQTEGAVALA